MRIQLKASNKKERMLQQTLLVYWGLIGTVQAEIKVLSYMISHSIIGVYPVRYNHTIVIAKYCDISVKSAKQALYTLSKKGFITFIHRNGTNSKGKGVYKFHPVFEQMTNQPNHLTFEFVNNNVGKFHTNSIPSIQE